MPYTLFCHPRVIEEDLPSIPPTIQHRVARAVAARLVSAPEQHGTPLRGTLRGYWKLRVVDYRVVFKLSGPEVWILGILHRKEVYQRIIGRIGRGPV